MKSQVLIATILLWIASLSCVFAGSIPVVVDHHLPDARPNAPVSFGVPFARNTLQADDTVQVVDDRGDVLPSQTHKLATWNPDGSDGIRWLLVDFQADRDRTYTIRYGDAPGSAPGAEALKPIARVDGDRIIVDTGTIRGTIPLNKADLFGDLTAMGSPLAEPGAFSGPYVEHAERGLFRGDLDPKPSVELEETGAVRAVVKLEGWYTNEAGEQFCRFKLRAHFFRGRSDVKLMHTFIFTGRSKDDKIAGLGVQVPQKPGQRGYMMGNDPYNPAMAMDFTSTGRYTLDAPDRQHVELHYHYGDGRRIRIADRAAGYMSYSSLGVAIRDAWQQYPWGFNVQEGVARIELWPSGGRLLDTTFDGYWWFLNEHQKRFMLGTKPKKPDDMDAWIARFREQVNATGAAKTHEVWLTFPSRQETAAVGIPARFGREVNYPVIAAADPAYMTATRALDYCAHTPRNDELFGDEERYLDAVLPMVRELTERKHWYGWWDWGGYHQHPGHDSRYPWADAHGLQTWHRNRPKSHYGWGQLPWLQYFRTADRKWLRYAQTYTLYSADRAHVHHTDHGRVTGEEYHYDHSDIPWVGGWQGNPSGAQQASNLQQKDDYVYMYWLTGDPHALEVLKNWGEQIQQYQSLYKYQPGFSRGNDVRNAGQQLHRLTMLYQATWDTRYLDMARTVADAFAFIQTPAEVKIAEGVRDQENYSGWYFHTACGWAWEGLWLYYNTTGDERIKGTLQAFIERSRDFDGGIGWGYGPIRAYTYGYELTGDTLYLDMIRAILDDYVAQWTTPAAWTPNPAKFTTITMGRAFGTLASAPEAWQAAHLPTNQRGRTLRFRYAAFRNSPSYAPARAMFNDTGDKPWSFTLLFSHGGRWTLTAPDGSTAFESPMYEDPFDQKWFTVHVPSDAQTGTYVLSCAEPSAWFKANTNPEYMAEARILRSDLPVVIASSPDASSRAMVQGRSLFFAVPSDAEGARVNLNAAQRARAFDLYAEGRHIASSLDGVPRADGIRTFALEPGSAYELRYGTPADAFFELWDAKLNYFWLDGAPDVVAGEPRDYFVPDPLPQ